MKLLGQIDKRATNAKLSIVFLCYHNQSALISVKKIPLVGEAPSALLQ